MQEDIPLFPVTDDILRGRSHWQHTGSKRPEFAQSVGPGQESVWDYPRPPRMEPCTETLSVSWQGVAIAQTSNGVRVLETAGAPTYYFPPDDVDSSLLEFGDVASVCEWKGAAQNIAIASAGNVGWRYVTMFPEFLDLYLWPSFYPTQLDCRVGDERVRPQPGGYYGGWVTDRIVGPIKGEPGSQGW